MLLCLGYCFLIVEGESEPHDGSWTFCSDAPCVTSAHRSLAKASHINTPELLWAGKYAYLIGKGPGKESYRAGPCGDNRWLF